MKNTQGIIYFPAPDRVGSSGTCHAGVVRGSGVRVGWVSPPRPPDRVEPATPRGPTQGKICPPDTCPVHAKIPYPLPCVRFRLTRCFSFSIDPADHLWSGY